jgi:hypothetical protein
VVPSWLYANDRKNRNHRIDDRKRPWGLEGSLVPKLRSPSVCQMCAASKEARYRDTVSAQLTADQSSASQTTDNSICC